MSIISDEKKELNEISHASRTNLKMLSNRKKTKKKCSCNSHAFFLKIVENSSIVNKQTAVNLKESECVASFLFSLS